MGWWKTQNGTVIGDPALDVLENHTESMGWKTAADIPRDVMTAIEEEYREGLGRSPTLAELDTLLVFHGGKVKPDTPGPLR